MAKCQILVLVRSMLSGAIGVARGSAYVAFLERRLGERKLNGALVEFRHVETEVDSLPLGSEREYWDPRSLETQDRIIAEYESGIRERMLAICRTVEPLLVADLLSEYS
jgi:hypothetical protein